MPGHGWQHPHILMPKLAKSFRFWKRPPGRNRFDFGIALWAKPYVTSGSPTGAKPFRLWNRPQVRSLSGETVGLPTGSKPEEPSKGKGQAGPMFFSCEVALRNFCPLNPPDFSYLPFSSYLSKFGTNIFRRETTPF